MPPCFAHNLVQLPSLPITEGFLLDYFQLEKSLEHKVLARPNLGKQTVCRRVGTVVSKVFDIPLREAETCIDLISHGALSFANMLNLTVELNTEFGTKLSVTDVSTHIANTSYLVDLVLTQLNKECQ